MPRDTVTVTQLTRNAATTQPAGTAINTTNGAQVDAAKADRIVLRVTNTNGTQRTVTIKAGANPPAFRAGLGDLAVVVPASTGDVLIPVESARFAQADGMIYLNFEASMAGVVSAVATPKG